VVDGVSLLVAPTPVLEEGVDEGGNITWPDGGYYSVSS